MAPSPTPEATQEERHGEIWSTRVQRELLALTTDEDSESAETKAMLPPFVTLAEHTLDITGATCTVSFKIDVKSSVVVVCMDASMPRGPDGKLLSSKNNSSADCYPFCAPVVTLVSGQELFPEGSTIKDGNLIAMDLDWTPSLHLIDAILNLALKIKESILQAEPFHPAPPVEAEVEDPVDEVLKSARRFGSSISKAFSPPARKAKKKPKSSLQAAAAAAAAAASGEVRIGDEINLLEEPWVSAKGVYSCKAIRRPIFVADAMTIAAEQVDEQQTFTSPTNVFRSFAQSARGVLEESFLMITSTHIIEMKASKLNLSAGKVIFAIPIDMMAKLKFRRKESITLFFKAAPNDPLVYMCPDSGDAVHQIQAVLKKHGVKGKHTNAAAFRAINDALHLVQEIQTKELALKHDPTVDRVNEIMDLYRQAAERFEVAGDMRHEEVVTHMRKFLALPLAASILDGSFKKPDEPHKIASKDGVPEGEVLERSDFDDEDIDGAAAREKEKENDKAFEENVDNLLKEAKEDFGNFNLDDSPSLETDSEDTALADVAADLDAMMREADKELAELMKA